MLLLALSAALAVVPAAEHVSRWAGSPQPENTTLPAATARSRRDAHSLIGTFDISNMFKKKPRPKSDADLRPSSSSLRAADPLPVIYPPAPKELSVPVTVAPTSTRQTLATLTAKRKGQPQSAVVVPSHKQLPASVPKRKKSRKPKNSPKTSKGTRATASRSDGTREVGNTTRRTAHAASDGIVWPVKHAAVVEGDIVLGGLMMVSTSLATNFISAPKY